MRHYFSLPRPIPGHAGGMHPPTVRGSLPASARAVQRLAARLSGAIAGTVDLPAIAVVRPRRPGSRTARTRTHGQIPER